MVFLDIFEVIRYIVNEDCVALCNKCHEFIHSRFNEFIDEIYEEADNLIYNCSILIENIKDIKNHFNVIINNINSFILIANDKLFPNKGRKYN